jgi:hypothetical protein
MSEIKERKTTSVEVFFKGGKKPVKFNSIPTVNYNGNVITDFDSDLAEQMKFKIESFIEDGDAPIEIKDDIGNKYRFECNIEIFLHR